jgi:tetratricopeptide (TPR) repeat protein
MKSGLWILGLVLIAAILVGLYFNQKHRDLRDWAEIESIDDPKAKISRLEAFIADYPENKHKQRAYEMLADLTLKEVGDTARFLGFAEGMIKIEADPECRKTVFAGLDRARRTGQRLTEIRQIEDPEARISGMKDFISEFPHSTYRWRAYSAIAGALVRDLQDTTRFLEMAGATIEQELDPESKAVMYYWLYTTYIDPYPDKALATARQLLEKPLDVDWIHSYIGYELGDRDLDLDLALSLCQKALELSKTREDTAGSYESLGWIYYKKGMYKKAVQDLEMAVALYGEPYDETLQHLAYAALKAGDGDKAFDTFRSILVMGEYEYARASLDSLMDARGYSQERKDDFERSVWESRIAGAMPAECFSLPTLAGVSYSYVPSSASVSLLNFMSPT